MITRNADYTLREISVHELKNALDLVWEVFQEFEAPDYMPEGIQAFQDFISYGSFLDRFISRVVIVYGCFDHTELLGIIAVRDKTHISLLFVRKNFHNRGIASALCRIIFKECLIGQGTGIVTVNSSPYAVGFYHRIGFKDTSSEQTIDGIRFTPMEYKL